MRRIAPLALMGLFLCSPVMAQMHCAPRKVITDQLARGYGERLSASGVMASGALVEIVEVHSTSIKT